MIEKFSVPELTALKNELAQSTLDSMQAAELLQMFLMGRGYGVSHEAARDAVCRMEGKGLDVIQKELEGLALVM